MPNDFLARTLGTRFFDRLAASPRGRVFILKFLVGAEEGDEAGVFDQLLARVDDPELRELVRRHRDDELRHAQVFRECLARQPIAGDDVPDPLGIIPFIDRELGGFMAAFVGDRRSVMEAYVLLQVIEERGVEQYPKIAEAIAPYDRESAETIQQVAGDELRHIKYAKAIGKRYAPDAATHASTLARFRTAEARGFAANGKALVAQAVDADLVAVGAVERLAWRGLVALDRLGDSIRSRRRLAAVHAN